jgi:hypothetical protein
MAISEPARSVDTHELMPAIFIRILRGGAYSCHNRGLTFFSDHIMYFCSAFVILSLFSSQVSFPKINDVFTGSKRDALPVIPDTKPEAWSKPEYFHLSICVEGPASTDDSVLSSLASRVVREAENLYIPGVNRRDSSDDVFAWSVQTSFLLTGSSG